MNNFVNNVLGGKRGKEIHLSSTACSQLIQRLSTDDSLLSFLWAMWRRGKKEVATGQLEVATLLARSKPCPARDWCAVVYAAGRAEKTWPAALACLVRDVDAVAPESTPEPKKARRKQP